MQKHRRNSSEIASLNPIAHKYVPLVHALVACAILVMIDKAAAGVLESAQQWVIGPRINVSGDDTAARDRSEFLDVSADGRFVVFRSSDATLDPSGNAARDDVYLRDTLKKTTIRISAPLFGDHSLSSSTHPAISASGRFIAFASNSANLVGMDSDGDGDCDFECDTNGVFDVFVHDRDSDENGILDEPGTTNNKRASVGSQGQQVDIGDSLHPDISADGQQVLFLSFSSELVGNDSNEVADLFVRNMSEGYTARVNVASNGAEANDRLRSGFAVSFQLSDTGRFVGFSSFASNLVLNDTNSERDAFLHDRDRDEDGVFDEPGDTSTTRVSLSDGGGQIADSSTFGSMARNGRLVTFMSRANEIVPGPVVNGVGSNIFVRDLLNSSTRRLGPVGYETEIVSCCSNGVRPNGMSDDGRFIALTSTRNVRPEPGLTVGVSDAYLYDRFSDELLRLTHSPDPASRDDPSSSARTHAISAHGAHLIVVGQLVEHFPPAIYPDEVLFIRNNIFTGDFEGEDP